MILLLDFLISKMFILNKKNYKFLIFTVILLVLILPVIVYSDTGSSEPIKIKNPIGVDSIQDLITKILDIMVQIGTPIAVLFIIYSGFLFVVARGNPEKINHAKEVFLYAIIGTVLLLGAFAISEIIKNTVNQITSYEIINEEIVTKT